MDSMNASRADRRRELRHAVNAHVRMFMDSPQTGMVAELIDLSPGGMCLRAPELRLRPSSLMQIRISRPDGSAALALAQVVRVQQKGIAFRFLDVCDSDRE